VTETNVFQLSQPGTSVDPLTEVLRKGAWRVVGVFGDQHMRDQCLGGYAVLDQPLRRRRLHHFAGARLAGIFGAMGHDHLELRRHNIEPFRDVLADPVLEAAHPYCTHKDIML
jgi:hypothetical protein